MEEKLGDILNWLKLTFLVDYVTPELRKLLLEKLKKMLDKEWDGSQSVFFLKDAIGKKQYKSASGSVRNKIDQGDIENWDLTAVSHVLRSLNSEWVSEEEKERMEAAVQIKNYLANHSTKVISQEEFDVKWQKLIGLLSFLNVHTAQIDEIEEKIKFRTSDYSSLFSPRVSNAEASKLIEEGSAAFRIADYAQAIEKFDDALKVASLKGAEQGVLFCYRSAACIQMAKEERYERKVFYKRARDDAKKASHLQPMWCKAHFRLGDAYKLLEKYEKAIIAYDEALSLDPSLEIVRTRRDDCRQNLFQRRTQDHMDHLEIHPLSVDLMIEQSIKNTMEKAFNELLEKYPGCWKNSGPGSADVVKGTWCCDEIDPMAYKMGAKYFSRATDEGNARDIYFRARLTKKGLGVKKDYRRAFQLFKQAAEMPPILPNGLVNEGVLPAMHCIAMMYYEGVGVDLSHYEAFKWYKRAADLGFGPSANNLTIMYETGKGVPEQDSEKAVQYWKLAAQGKSTRAMHALAGLDEGLDEGKRHRLDHMDTMNMPPLSTEGIIKQINQNQKNKILTKESYEELMDLLKKGGHASAITAYDEAIEKFYDALNVVSLKEAERAVLFSNRSSAFLQMAKAKQDQERKHFAKRAENDAKKAAHLQPMWYKAHLRLGDAYKLQEKYEKAITTYDEALSLDPSLEIVRTRRDECRQELGKRQRRDHMDTMNMHPPSTDARIEQISQSDDVSEGIRYRNGVDTVINYELAAKHFSRAARKGDAQGTYELAHLTKNGLGVKKDYPLALELYKKAAEMPPFLSDGGINEGVRNAMHSIALMYDEGVGVEMSPVTAFEWYKRAADLGFGPSANNLAIMYNTGKGVPEQDSEKAVQYWKLAAHGKITRAMHNLAEYYLKTRNAGQARTWFKFAVEGEEIEAMSSQQEFEAECKAIEEEQEPSFPDVEKWEKENNLSSSNLSGKGRLYRFLYSNHPDMHKCMEQIDHIYRRSIAVSPSVPKKVYKYDYKVIAENASQGRVYAQQVLRAMDHCASAFKWLTRYETSKDASFGDFVIAEAAHCFETAAYVFAVPEEHTTLLTLLVKKKLANLKGQTCEMDCYARQCYAYLQLSSYAENVKFLEKCVDRYPKVPYFYDALASVHGFLKTYDEGFKVAQKALDLFPDNYELMYSKAALAKLASDGTQGMQNVIHCYEAFLQHAPSDHRKVPESYYSMAQITLADKEYTEKDETFAPIDEAIRTYYEKGLESEKQLLPCFLPYEDSSTSKGLVGSFLEINAKCSKEKRNVSGKSAHNFKESPRRKMTRLTDPVRVQTILDHRKSICANQGIDFNSTIAIARTITPRYTQCAPPTLVGLKAVTLSEMNPMVDKVYEGHVIEVVIIDDPVPPPSYSLRVVLEDSEGDVMRGFFYNVEGDQRIKYGAKISIVHPYMRIGANDQKPGIRVDDPKTLFFHQEEPSVRRCRYCGEKNAKFSCTLCKTADYCSKECQTNDWKILKHKLICNL